MGSEWPDGWISATLTEADIPVTDFARKVMQAWQQSTPMLPYTNNPVGMPAVKGITAELMRTGYAMFATMPLFRARFAVFLKTPEGAKVRDALALSEKYGPAWRAIHALAWPANTTETDWPSGLLDLMAEPIRARLASVSDSADRKTSGAYGSQTALATQQGISARRTAVNTNRMQRANDAVRYNMRGY